MNNSRPLLALLPEKHLVIFSVRGLSVKEQIPDARFVGVAGPLMQAEGCEAWYEMEELVMGIVEVLGRLPRLLSIRKDLTQRFYRITARCFCWN